MKQITITPNKLAGSILIKPSKSYLHRLFLAAGLTKGKTEIGYSPSDDVDTTLEALAKLNVTYVNNIIEGKGIKLLDQIFNMRSSGSSMRFLIPLLLSFKEEVRIVGNPDLLKRSLTTYQKAFEGKNVVFEKKEDGIVLKGALKGGNFEIEGHHSSQFLTGLLYALPLLKTDSTIKLTTPLVSKGYVAMTLDVLKQFKIDIKEDDGIYHVKGNQSYVSPNKVSVEGDYSQAAFFIVAGLIGKKISIEGLAAKSLQPDFEIINIAQKMNGNLAWSDDALIAKPSDIKATAIDLLDCPDLGPALMILASLAEGTSVFSNIHRLIDKESNRLLAMQQALTKFGVEHQVVDNQLFIKGQGVLNGGQTFDTFNDHRIAMALAIASIKTNDRITLDNKEVVNKSYPEFFALFKKLGGIVNDA
ncbi:MAG: 3-phosphoshikimate 1-carboxyvinyltransferase [Acholeplasmataceae bacterium]